MLSRPDTPREKYRERETLREAEREREDAGFGSKKGRRSKEAVKLQGQGQTTLTIFSARVTEGEATFS